MASGTETRQRDRLLQIRLTTVELAQIAEAADRRGLTASSHAREVLLTGAAPLRAVRRPPVVRTELAQLLAKVGGLGTDIRQLARTSARGDPSLARIAGDVEQLRDLLMQALGRRA